MAWRATVVTGVAGIAVALPAAVALADRPGPGDAGHGKHHGWSRPDVPRGRRAGCPCPQPAPHPGPAWFGSAGGGAAPVPPAATRMEAKSVAPGGALRRGAPPANLVAAQPGHTRADGVAQPAGA